MTHLARVYALHSPALPIDVAALAAPLAGVGQVTPVFLPPGAPWETITDAAALFVRSGNINAPFLGLCPELRVVTVHGVGVEQVDVEACWERGIAVTNVPGGNANAVAELALGLMLDLARGISRQDRAVRRERWGTCRIVGRELAGASLGIAGFGHIGRLLGAKATALGMEVLAYDRFVPDGAIIEAGARPVALEDLFAASDYISLHLPLTGETRRLVGAPLLDRMKSTAFLINTSRGGVVDQEALYHALACGRIAGAGLDVQDPEPPPPGGRLAALDNVVLLPHAGGSTVECLAEIATLAGEDIARVLQRKRPRFPVRGQIMSGK
jgi:D-3-phosphoglycerate dehydrogenase